MENAVPPVVILLLKLMSDVGDVNPAMPDMR